MKVFTLVWEDGVVAGVYKDRRRAEVLLFGDYTNMLKNSVGYNGKMVAQDLAQYFEEGCIPGIGRIYETEVIE